MNEPVQTLSGLAQRLERVERQNRNLRILATSFLFLIGVACIAGKVSSHGEVVEASQFLLRDGKGNVRAELMTEAAGPLGLGGNPKLVLYDEKRMVRASLLLDSNNSPALILSDGEGRVRAAFEMEHGGSPHLTLFHKGPKKSFDLSQEEDGSGGMVFYDQEGVWRADVIIDPDGKGRLEFADKSGTERATLSAAKLWLDGDSPSVSLARDTKLRSVLGATALTTSRTGDVTQRSPSSLVLFDKDGKVIWSAP